MALPSLSPEIKMAFMILTEWAVRILQCCTLLQLGAAGVGGSREGFLVQRPIKDGGVSGKQKKQRQGPAFIVLKQDLHSKAPKDHPSRDGRILSSTLILQQFWEPVEQSIWEIFI